jgi:hypothetical protein
MTPIYLVGVGVRGYADVTMHGPYSSIDEARRKITDDVDRGSDGDETQYTFFRVDSNGVTDVGYVHLRSEDETDDGEDLRSESFYER